MSALDALRSYGDVDSSSSDDEDHQENGKKIEKSEDISSKQLKKTHQPLPAVPLEVLGMFQDKDASDEHSNSDLHDGRIRSFDHIRGNWATLVYVPAEPPDTFQVLAEELISIVSSSSSSMVAMKPMDDFHVSLSRTVALQLHWIEPFTQSLRNALSIGCFMCDFDGVEMYSNDEKTRSFLSLKVGHGSHQFEYLTRCVDKCLADFTLPGYYQNPSFHVSLAWCLGDYRQFIDTNSLQRIQECFKRHIEEKPLVLQVSEVRCKTGNKYHSFCLR